MKEIDTLIEYYLNNAKLLRQTFESLGFDVYGGVDAPYIFVYMRGQGSWDAFREILEGIYMCIIFMNIIIIIILYCQNIVHY